MSNPIKTKTKKNHKFKKGDCIYDTWWPTRFGTITRAYKTCVRIRFSNCDYDVTYDRDHLKFLRKM